MLISVRNRFLLIGDYNLQINTVSKRITSLLKETLQFCQQAGVIASQEEQTRDAFVDRITSILQPLKSISSLFEELKQKAQSASKSISQDWIYTMAELSGILQQAIIQHLLYTKDHPKYISDLDFLLASSQKLGNEMTSIHKFLTLALKQPADNFSSQLISHISILSDLSTGIIQKCSSSNKEEEIIRNQISLFLQMAKKFSDTLRDKQLSSHPRDRRSSKPTRAREDLLIRLSHEAAVIKSRGIYRRLDKILSQFV